MVYLALGDSISIDDYTGVEGGGAASQFARLINAYTFLNLTVDGLTTAGVIDSLKAVIERPDIVTITAGGNDFLQTAFWGADPATKEGLSLLVTDPLARLSHIAQYLAEYAFSVIMNTVYDPTDGDDEVGESLSLKPVFRRPFLELNDGIRTIARSFGYLLSDLALTFTGHGIGAKDSWI